MHNITLVTIGLAFFHTSGIIHGDFKTGNILFTCCPPSPCSGVVRRGTSLTCFKQGQGNGPNKQ